MKKLLALIVCALLAFTLASCVHTHTEVIDEAVAPTCTESGLTEGKHCSECGEVLVKQEIIEAKGHVWVDLKCENCGCDYYSEGLEFTSNGDGTCYVSGIGTCSDTEVVIPETSPDGDRVIGIGESAFYYCKSLTSIEIPASVTSIGDSAFYDCKSLASIEIPASVTSIGDNAFYYCTLLTSVTFADGSQLTSIGEGEFSHCYSLIRIEIPASVTSIGDRAFERCSLLSEIKVADGNTNYKDIDGNLYSYEGTELIQYAVGKTDYAFIIPASVTDIGNGAFYYCKSLTSIEIPASVTSIGDEAFYYCSSLTSIEIPASVTSIDGWAFSSCDSLTSVTFEEGSQLISIGEFVFNNCESLTSIVIPASVTSIGEWAFFACTSLTSIEISASVTSIGKWAFFTCDSLTSVTFAEGSQLTSIGNGAFSNCKKLTDVYYAGTEAQWAEISIGSNNSYLTNATIHYNYITEE